MSFVQLRDKTSFPFTQLSSLSELLVQHCVNKHTISNGARAWNTIMRDF